MLENVSRTTAMIKNVAEDASRQSASIDQVNQAVESVEEVTQANAANAQQSAASSQQLTGLTESIHELSEDLAHLIGETSFERSRREDVTGASL